MKSFDGYLKKKLGKYALLANGSDSSVDTILGKVFHSNANSSTDLTHHATASEVALETGDGSGGVSAWIWRENYSSNWGIFHDNSSDIIRFVGNDTARVDIALGSNSLKVGGTEVSLDGHTHNYAGAASSGGHAYYSDKLYYAQTTYLSTKTDIDAFHEANTLKCALWNGSDANDSLGTSYPGASNGIIINGGWASTDYGFQLAIDDDPNWFMALRQRSGGGWAAWKRIPMADGTGASGTWGINISGSAASSTSSDYPYGFTSRGTTDWSGVSGTFATDWSVNGADIMFKYDGSKLNVITDGYFYQGIDIYGSSKRVLDEYDFNNSSWPNATAASFLSATDSRNSYPGSIVSTSSRGGLAFLYGPTLGINNYSTWYDTIILRSYMDSSGGNDNAIMFGKLSSDVWHTSFGFGSTNSWGTPYLFLDTNNYTSYALHTELVTTPQDTTYGNSMVAWAQSYALAHPKSFVYNTYGAEYAYLNGMNTSGTHGTILKIGYSDRYLRILRKAGGWYSDDWEKIYAGYADSAGNADTIGGYSPSAFVPKLYNSYVYNFIGASQYSGTGWYLVTFPHAGITEATTYWIMLSMDVIFGGSYNSGPNGKVRLSYYFYRDPNSYTTGVGNVYAVAFGNDMSAIRICYNPNDAGYMYIYNGGQYYATVSIKNLTITDNGSSYPYLNTTIVPCDAPSGVTDVNINKIYSNGTGDMLLNGYTILHSNNFNSWALRKDASDSTPYQYTFSKTDDHAIQIGTIRGYGAGSCTGNYLHLYERVHIGSPSGWGSREAPSYGLSTYGGAWLATDTGNVGVGTTSPSMKLHINGDGILLNSTATCGINMYSSHGESSISYKSSGGSRTVIGTYTNRTFLWNETLGEHISILSSNGYMGIGTSSPAYKLEVIGSIYTNDKLSFPHGGSTYSWNRIDEGYNRTSIRAYCTAGESASGARDNYSIGLMIDGYYSFALAAYSGGAYLSWRNSSGTWYDIITSENIGNQTVSAANSVLWTGVANQIHGGNEFNVIDSGYGSTTLWINYTTRNTRDGNASINAYYLGNGHGGYSDTTMYLGYLNAANSISSSGISSSGTIYSSGLPAFQTNVGTGNWNYIRMHNGSNFWDIASNTNSISDGLEIRPSGSTSQCTFYIDGHVTFRTDVYAANFYTTSDRSKKQNISEFSEHIRKFQLKNTEKWHYGVIAQEVPEIFRLGEEGNMTVNYNSVLSYYIGCLENKIKQLEEKINTLENK